MAEYDALDRMSRTLRGSNSLPPRSPAGNMADDLVRNARQPLDPSRSFAAPNTGLPPGPGSAIPRTFNAPTGGLPPGMSSNLAGGPAAAAAEAAHGERVNPTLKPNNPAFHGDGRYGAPGAAPAAPGAAPAAAAPSTASKLFGSADDWKNALKGPADSPHKTLRMTVPEAPGKFAKGLGVLQGAMGAKNAYDGIQEGDNWKAGVGAADAVAGAALFTPAAPAAGAYLGLRGAWDGAKMAGAAISDRLSEGAKDAIGGTVNQIGLNTGLWGTDDSAKMQLDAEQRLRGPAQSSAPAAAPSARPDPRNPYADANARKIAESDAKNAAGAPAPGGYDPNQSRPDLGYGPIGDRTKLTNEQAAIMNPAGRVTMTRGANGNMEFSGGNVSGQVSYNDADGKAYAGGGLPLPGGGSQGFSNFDVAPAGADVAMGPGGYAFATSGSGLRGQGGSAGGAGSGYTSDGIDVRGLRGPQADQYAAEVRQARAINQASQRGALHSGNDWESRNTLRNLEFDASTKLGGRKIYQNAVAMDQLKRAGADPGSVARTTADASRYDSDNSLRGQMYTADAQRGGKQAETQQKLREQQLMGALWKAADGNPAVFQNLAMRYGLADAAKQGGDMVGAQQTRAKANSEDAQSTFKGLFTDKDNKRDEHAEAQAHQLASQIVPGWENMGIEQRNANRAKVVDATRAVQGMNSLRNNGWLQAAGWDKPTPEYSQLPDLDGATVSDVGFLEGAARKAVGKNDIKIALRNGENRFIPAGTLSEAQLRMLQDNGATRSTR